MSTRGYITVMDNEVWVAVSYVLRRVILVMAFDDIWTIFTAEIHNLKVDHTF